MYFELWADDNVMRNYVSFICTQIGTNCRASVMGPGGWKNSPSSVPAKVVLVEKDMRTAKYKVTIHGVEKEILLMMSRHKSPVKILGEFQDKINELSNEIIKEHSLDANKLWSDNHPLKNLKLPK